MKARIKPMLRAVALAAGIVSTAGMAKAGFARSAGAGATLVDQVAALQDQFRYPSDAVAAGYAPGNTCVSGDNGAMGVHYVHVEHLLDDRIDPSQPEALVYAPNRFGQLTLVAAEYIVFADAWHASHEGPPDVAGQAMEYLGAPNRYDLPAVFELHVWAFRYNPNGMFADFNPNVSCVRFVPAPAT